MVGFHRWSRERKIYLFFPSKKGGNVGGDVNALAVEKLCGQNDWSMRWGQGDSEEYVWEKAFLSLLLVWLKIFVEWVYMG